ncbi:phospholipase D-like domain-containing protein [Myxococcus eversor]|uniref:phospholipase D-like domain-containing protein n=1 Tax=Myxococcus eversor TaxID=2709661 RepID=UPI0013D56E13|nr:phospholipase D-like domain-containing protein [Myxococcus eversor]
MAPTHNNTAVFLMDGEEYFDKFRDCLYEVRDAQVDPKTYVRLGWWCLQHDTLLDRHAGKNFGQCLKEVADQGHPVDICLWQPDDVTVKGLELANMSDHFSLHTLAKNKATRSLLHDYQQRIQVYLEKHSGVGVGYSLHQKIAIFSIAGTLKVLVGGFNIEPEYWDNIDHSRPYGHSCHDTGVLLQGPVTIDIEEEWLRRWKKQIPTIHLFGPPHPAVARSKVQALANGQVIQNGNVTVTALTTNSESLSNQTHIRDKLVDLISHANKYIYIENFQFFNPELVKAVRTRIKQMGARQLKVVLVIPDPLHDADKGVTYLTRITYAMMAVESGYLDENCLAVEVIDGEITYNSDQRQQFTRATYSKDDYVWEIDEPSVSLKDWPQQDYRLVLTHKKTRARKEVRLDAVLRFIHKGTGQKSKPQPKHADVAPKIQVYFPYRYGGFGKQPETIYLHTKLMIIDSQHVVLGSANFDCRAMDYDGELDVHVDDAGFANHVKARLVNHYGIHGMYEVPRACWNDSAEERHQAQCVGLARREPEDLWAMFEDVGSSKKLKFNWL